LAWAAAVERVAAVAGQVPVARDLAVQVAAEQVWAARACGNLAGCRVAALAAQAAAQAGDRDLALAQAPEAEEVPEVAVERVVGVV
jgi:hypothetical protein